jgi:hypothetical protein
MNTFKKIQCTVCRHEISTGGAAYTSHMRKHVKNKEVMEFKQGNKLIFMTEIECRTYMDQCPYAIIGNEPLLEQPKDVWEIPQISNEMPMIDPSAYFITSGEAVKKAEKLVQDVYSLAVKARAFRDKLIRCRGEKKYLETSRENGRLIIKSKNPRKFKEETET